MLKRIKKEQTLAELALKEIRDYIVRANLKPGDKLPSEAELVHQLGCGKSSVREALKSLEALGIIKIIHGTGAVVNKFDFNVIFENLPYHLQVSRHDLQELFEIREAFEIYFLDRAIETINSQKIAQLEKLVRKMEEAAREGKSFGREDFMFHQLLFESLNNAAALKLMRVFWDFLFRSRCIPANSTEPVPTAESHRRILDAIKEHDVIKAQKAMKDHFSEIKRRFQNKE